MLELRNVHRYFGETRAVEDVSFTVDAGQVLGYIGPNGAGKTTSMRILATLDLPTHGDAFVDGFSVVNDPDRVRRRLGFMPDYFGTYPNVSVRDYLDFFARSYQLSGRERVAAIRRTMAFTKLDELANKPIAGLSKGMKQRLSLGRSMIHDPAVLVLDEPAAGLDPRARIQLREMIRALAEDGKAVLISSHILTELSEICDVVGIIEQGKLLVHCPVDELQNEQQSQSAVRIKILGDAATLTQWLEARGDVTEIRADGPTVKFLHGGGEEAQADLLREIVEAGFRVISFGVETKSLEDIFMQITEGRVQ
ncbi:MAG: ABC transporter ATP-binding protein [Planctomycetales bacterium]